jgi:hypothetical protein
MITEQAKVKTIAVGGRPGADGDPVAPMQAVGGVRGANVWDASLIRETVAAGEYLFRNSSYSQQASLEMLAAKYRELPNFLSTSTSFNIRDSIRQGDDAQVPLQFVYKAADCRIFYGPLDHMYIPELWRTVYSVAWEGGKCAFGEGYKPAAVQDTGGQNKREGRKGGEGRKMTRRWAGDATPNLALWDVDGLGGQWRKLSTDRGRIHDMGRAFQMP